MFPGYISLRGGNIAGSNVCKRINQIKREITVIQEHIDENYVSNFKLSTFYPHVMKIMVKYFYLKMENY